MCGWGERDITHIRAYLSMTTNEQSFSMGERLARERKRLGLSQSALATELGVSLRSQQNYEKNLRNPDAGYWMAIASFLGVDVQYVLTGVHSANLDEVIDKAESTRGAVKKKGPQGEKEWQWLEWYRQIPEDQRRYVEVVVEGFAAGQQAGEEAG